MSRTNIRHVIAALAAAALLVLGALLIRRGPVKTARPGPRDKTVITLTWVQSLIRVWQDKHGYERYPPARTLEQLEAQILTLRDSVFRTHGVPEVDESGPILDGWGRRLRLKLKPDPEPYGLPYIVYSVGPNGLDEGGGGDDMQ